LKEIKNKRIVLQPKIKLLKRQQIDGYALQCNHMIFIGFIRLDICSIN